MMGYAEPLYQCGEHRIQAMTFRHGKRIDEDYALRFEARGLALMDGICSIKM